MNVLHIANCYGATVVHQRLCSGLDRLGIRQVIYVPLNVASRSRANSHPIPFAVDGSKIIYSTALQRRHRYLYDQRIECILRHIQSCGIALPEIDVIHASTWCSDGAVAHELSKLYTIPYLLTVRNTDLGTYYKLLPHRRAYFRRILKNAKQVVFLSEQFRRNVSRLLRNHGGLNKENTIVVPNGIDSTFLSQLSTKTRPSNPIRVVYAGGFQRNKNILATIDAIELLRGKGHPIVFTAIGRGLEHRVDAKYQARVERRASGLDWVSLQDSQSASQLVKSLRAHDIFVMVSHRETFGLSYVEALSQGLPIIYTKGQGFDGTFADGFAGFAATSTAIADIAAKIESVIHEYATLTRNVATIDFGHFDWEDIVSVYRTVYEHVVDESP